MGAVLLALAALALVAGAVVVLATRLCPRCGGIMRPERFPEGWSLYCRGCGRRDR